MRLLYNLTITPASHRSSAAILFFAVTYVSLFVLFLNFFDNIVHLIKIYVILKKENFVWEEKDRIMDTPQTLQIKLLGEFSISNCYHTLTTSKKSGINSFLFLAYLLSNKGNHVTSTSLIDVLWPSDATANPDGALRTLIYRTRKELANFFPDDTVELINKTNNIYSWNFDVPCHIDIYEFENYYHKAFREPDKKKQFELLSCAFDLYKGEFLSIFSYHSWVMFRNNYYGNLYINCVNKMCQYLDEKGNYEDIVALCEKALEYAPATDETLHKQKMYALLNLNKSQTALDYYHSIVDMFNREYDLDISGSMRDIYEKILSGMPNHYQTISALEANLRHKEPSPGSFYCNFDIFQNIYQINLRSARRSQRLRFLILLTLVDSENKAGTSGELKEEMDILQQIMEAKLRSNDVYTKSSICQYSLIIAATNEAGCDVVKRRLVTSYNSKKQHKNISLTIESKEIW